MRQLLLVLDCSLMLLAAGVLLSLACSASSRPSGDLASAGLGAEATSTEEATAALRLWLLLLLVLLCR